MGEVLVADVLVFVLMLLLTMLYEDVGATTLCYEGLCKSSFMNKTCTYPVSWRCDGTETCFNGFDEANCSFTCRGSGYCDNAECQPFEEVWLCNGVVDCDNAVDESQCSSTSTTDFNSPYNSHLGLIIAIVIVISTPCALKVCICVLVHTSLYKRSRRVRTSQAQEAQASNTRPYAVSQNPLAMEELAESNGTRSSLSLVQRPPPPSYENSHLYPDVDHELPPSYENSRSTAASHDSDDQLQRA